MEGCIYNIFEDPTEHVNLKDSLPDVWTQMLSKLNAHGKTVYQTDYAEPNTTECFTGAQAAAYYVGHNTCKSPGWLCVQPTSRTHAHDAPLFFEWSVACARALLSYCWL